mmetsp:Transcript_76573/g.214046  ORF Transcript_76573/g.214046 Transcript_76573/m.214046 type:complete len:901 (+) Transcript_76573:92-2794(+)
MAKSVDRTISERAVRAQDKARRHFFVRLCMAGTLLTVLLAVYNFLDSLRSGTWFLVTYVKLAAMLSFIFAVMVGERIWGLTKTFKVTVASGMFCVGVFIAVLSRPSDNWHLFSILMLDFACIMASDEDEGALQGLSIALFLGYVVYVFLHTLSVNGTGPEIHPIEFHPEYHVGNQLFCSIIPVLLNYLLIVSYARDLRRESTRVRNSVELVSTIAEALNNFDIERAQLLLPDNAGDEDGDSVCKQLGQLIYNLQVYRPFLPNYLFPQQQNDGGDSDPTGGAIAKAMWGHPTFWDNAASAAMRLRDPAYTLNEFHSDVAAAFPELQLYNLGSQCSSGRTCSEEHQRTLGALYSVYCVSRLDIDGKEIFAFGVDSHGKPAVKFARECTTPGQMGSPRLDCDPTDPRLMFYMAMDWDRMLDLFIRAGLLRYGGGRDRSISDTGTIVSGILSSNMSPQVSKRESSKTPVFVEHERMTAFLALTAFHDIMKNSMLLPTVHGKHAPYYGLCEGDQVHDHDLALRYIMEHFPGLLPSFNGLGPAQRAVLFFTQGKMGFNNGWLVQGEAPPGALFSKFKEVITVGGASDSDISFYFAHWLTDLAGAEPFGEGPWPGSEKFVRRFPLKVLNAFLDSFAYVNHLNLLSEVQVMEDYLRARWEALALPAGAPEGCAVAAMRLALMAQGFEPAAMDALRQLPASDRNVLAAELARTGLRQQFAGAPAEVRSQPRGPALLIYYAPGLIQKAGAPHVGEALQILAALCRAARRLFPLDAAPHLVERTVVVRIEAMKVLSPPEIRAAGTWLLRATTAEYAVAELCSAQPRGLPEVRAAAADAPQDRPEDVDADARVAIVEIPPLQPAPSEVRSSLDVPAPQGTPRTSSRRTSRCSVATPQESGPTAPPSPRVLSV